MAHLKWYYQSDSCTAQFYISEQEKMVIKMLYSPAIKSGLRKEEFMKQFKLSWNALNEKKEYPFGILFLPGDPPGIL